MSDNGERKLARAGELSAPSKFRVGSYLFRECCRLQRLVGYFEPQCLIVDALCDSIVHHIAPFRLSPLWAKADVSRVTRSSHRRGQAATAPRRGQVLLRS